MAVSGLEQVVIAIILLTCDRPKERCDYARMALRSLEKLVTDEEIWLHIADDGSSPAYRNEMIAAARAMYGARVSITNAKGSGYGANYNVATQVVHGIDGVDLILPLEDDWELIRPLDLAPFASVLRAGVFGCVRMGYIGFTQELRASFVSHAGYHWLALDPESAEPHVFAGGPRLETVAWERNVGPWDEHLPAGVTEFNVAHRPQARVGIGWPVGLIKPQGDAFVHVGALKADMAGSAAAMQAPS